MGGTSSLSPPPVHLVRVFRGVADGRHQRPVPARLTQPWAASAGGPRPSSLGSVSSGPPAAPAAYTGTHAPCGSATMVRVDEGVEGGSRSLRTASGGTSRRLPDHAVRG